MVLPVTAESRYSNSEISTQHDTRRMTVVVVVNQCFIWSRPR